MKKVVSSLLCVYLVLGIICSSGFMYLFASRRIGSPAIPQAETRYYATDSIPINGLSYETYNEYVFYDHSVEDNYYNFQGLPAYFASGISNGCAVTSGGMVVGFYDRFYEELIPNHDGIYMSGSYVYRAQDDAVDAMHQDLYVRMGSDSQGTSVFGYVNGLGAYVRSKGRTASIVSAFNYNNLDFESCQEALNDGKLVALFVNDYSFLTYGGIYSYDGYDILINNVMEGRHVLTINGYLVIDYYNSENVLIQKDLYFHCHSGTPSAGSGYVRISKYTTVEDAYIINIT